MLLRCWACGGEIAEGCFLWICREYCLCVCAVWQRCDACLNWPLNCPWVSQFILNCFFSQILRLKPFNWLVSRVVKLPTSCFCSGPGRNIKLRRCIIKKVILVCRCLCACLVSGRLRIVRCRRSFLFYTSPVFVINLLVTVWRLAAILTASHKERVCGISLFLDCASTAAANFISITKCCSHFSETQFHGTIVRVCETFLSYYFFYYFS